MASTQVLDPIKLAMKRANDLFNIEVFGKGNFAAIDEIYTEDARILPPGAPMISGREAIKQFWSAAIQSMHATSAVLSSVEVTMAGDGVVEIGAATRTLEPPGEPAAQMEVKYVVCWREEAGKWKWHVDIWNSNA
jgi:ketosteroid isomerase-like protein